MEEDFVVPMASGFIDSESWLCLLGRIRHGVQVSEFVSVSKTFPHSTHIFFIENGI